MSATFKQSVAAPGPAEKSENFLLSIELAHAEVELSMAALEGILLQGRLSDVSRFSAVRSRLANFNLIRARVAREACSFLIAARPDERLEALRELERCEIEHFQMVSGHIGTWTPQAVQNDWRGYVKETRKILGRVRQLVLTEEMQLLPRLRAASRTAVKRPNPLL